MTLRSQRSDVLYPFVSAGSAGFDAVLLLNLPRKNEQQIFSLVSSRYQIDQLV